MATTPLSQGGEEISVPTCRYCSNENAKQCLKCQRHFCPEHCSKISPQFCQDCFSQVTVILDKYTKITEEYDDVNDVVIQHKSSARRIRLDGPDWVWYAAAINHLSDDELKAMFEFHKFMVSLIEHVQTVKKVADLQKLQSDNRMGVRLTSTTTTQTKRVKKVKQQKSLRQILMDSGLRGDKLEAMLKKMEAADDNSGTASI